MVMKAQPWSEALDHVLAQDNPSSAKPRLIVPGPGGQPFTQALARELAHEPWLAFACGRYEGIDERVYDHAREDLGLEVSVVSLGDYVLNGGEVAVLAMVEAVGRLVPGVIGNAESLVEESHEDGLLEYPIYTKPAAWNGRDVPPVLLSGNHGAIAAWRHEQRLARTAARRPDLLHASHAAPRRRRRRDQRCDARATCPSSPCSCGRAGCRRPSPTTPSTSRPCTRASTTSGRASTRRRRGSPAAAAGSSAPCARLGRVRRRLVRRSPLRRPRPAGSRARPTPPRARRVDGAGRHTHVHAQHGRAQRRQPADVQEGGLPPRRRARARSRARSPSSSVAAAEPGASSGLTLTTRGRRRGRRAAGGAGG